MHYEGTVIRPPSEAGSIILQVTVGCPHNRCTFCASYKEVEFRIKDEATIEEDLDFAAAHCQRQNSIFLADGDVLSLPQEYLIRLFARIRKKIKKIKRIRLYGRARSILDKSPGELRALKKLGLDRIYMGMESGSDRILKAVRKGADSGDMVRAARRVRREADIFLSSTILLGLGGEDLSREHARQTGKVVSFMEPNQIAILTLMLLPGSDLYDFEKSGIFKLPGARDMMAELYLLIENIRVNRSCQIQINHASNYLAIEGRLPIDRQKILNQISGGIKGLTPLKKETERFL